MRLSKILGMQAFSRDGKVSGYVLSAVRCDDTLLGFICCDEREREFFAEGGDLIIHEDKLYFKETGKTPKTGKNVRLGYPVYSHLGKFLGHAEDFIVKGAKIVHMTVGNKKYAFGNLKISDAVIVDDGRTDAELKAKDLLIDAMLS